MEVTVGSTTEYAPPKAKGRAAYDRLLKMIATLELEPGEILNESNLMRILEVGRTPLREALARLSTQGLVVLRPYQSPQVSTIQAFEIADIVEMRTVIEVATVRLAAERSTEFEVEKLHRLNAAYKEAVNGGDAIHVAEIDGEIHRTIALAARNQHLLHAYDHNNVFLYRLWYLSVRRGGPLSRLMTSHDEIISAIGNHDPKSAEAAIKAHVDVFRTRMHHVVTGYPSPQ